jgi:CelD/BcsL family acetyltransferase involved in cellulose biosynthesis
LIGVKDETTAVAAMIKAAEVLGMGHAVEYKSHGGLASGVVDALGIRPGPSPVLSTLSLEPDFQSQTMRFGKSRRRGLRTRSRRAEEQSIALSITDEPSRDVLAEWYDLHVRLYRDKHLMITQPFELFEHLLCRPCFRGMGRLVLAKVGKRIIGGIVVLVSGDLWEYSWAAYDRRYARVAVNSLLINFAIKTAIEEGARVFSFGASDPRNHDLVSFKASWGCYSKPVNYYYWNCYPPRNRGLRAGQRVVNVLPCWTLRRLSKVAARWLV